MNKEILYEIGLTNGEVKAYLALLKIGQSSIGGIVKESGVTKSKIYDILDKLVQKGLVSISFKNKVRHYNASPPNFLLDLLHKKQEKIKEQEKEISELLPTLMNIQSSNIQKQRTEIFEGFRGLKNAFQIVENEFNQEEEFLVFGVDDTLNKQQLNFFLNFHKKRINAKIRTKVIFTKNLRGVKEHHQKINKYNEERFLDQTSAIPINIYKDITIIPILKKEEKEITIFIRSKTLAEGFKQYFYTLWKISKK